MWGQVQLSAASLKGVQGALPTLCCSKDQQVRALVPYRVPFVLLHWRHSKEPLPRCHCGRTVAAHLHSRPGGQGLAQSAAVKRRVHTAAAPAAQPDACGIDACVPCWLRVSWDVGPHSCFSFVDGRRWLDPSRC